jgi:hypothetical protein
MEEQQRMSQATPYTVSPALLAREEFRAACTSRDFGKLFALMRQYDGASQDRISSPVEGLTQSRVSKIMRGSDRVSSLDLVERICDGLRIPGSYFGLATREWEAPAPPVLDATTVSVGSQRAPVVSEVRPVNGDTHPGPGPVPAQRAFTPSHIGRPVGLRPHIERAFTDETVTIDFAGFSGETLAGAISEPLDQVRAGQLRPASIRLRILVPNPQRPWSLPCRIEDLEDEPAFRRRMAGIMDRSLATIIDSVAELRDRDAVTDATAEVRVHGLPPVFKLYVVNGTEAFFGFYPIGQHIVTAEGTTYPMFDTMGKDSILFHHSIGEDPQSPNAQYVTEARTWFDSVWTSISRAYEP